MEIGTEERPREKAWAWENGIRVLLYHNPLHWHENERIFASSGQTEDAGEEE